MPRQRTKEEMAEYQRARRGRLQEEADGDQVHPVTGKRYWRDGARLGDGLADTNVLIGRMSQHARDRILAHPAISPPRRGS